jgi:DNA-binding NarL/FixJ family response regulator
MDGNDPIELMLVDEHPLVRAGIRTMLENEQGLKVVEEFDSVDAAVAFCRVHRPDVVVMEMDLTAPGLLHSVQRLRRECAETAVVVVSHRDGDEELFQAALAGASGHLAEADHPSELVATIRQAAVGDEPIGQRIARRPEVSRRVLEMYRLLAQSTAGQSTDEIALSARELEILRHVAEGLTNRQIGRAMGLSEYTVKSAVSSILRRLGLRHRTEAVVHAVRHDWISVPDMPVRAPVET